MHLVNNKVSGGVPQVPSRSSHCCPLTVLVAEPDRSDRLDNDVYWTIHVRRPASQPSAACSTALCQPSVSCTCKLSASTRRLRVCQPLRLYSYDPLPLLLYLCSCTHSWRSCTYAPALTVGALVPMLLHSQLALLYLCYCTHSWRCSPEMLWSRTQTTVAHVLLIGLSTLPVMLLQYFFIEGIDKFGYIGMYFQTAVLFSLCSGCLFLTVSLPFSLHSCVRHPSLQRPTDRN